MNLRRSAFKILGLLLVAAFSWGCASTPKKEPVRSDKEIYQEAERKLERKKYEQAREDLGKILTQYPESDLAPLAKLSIARAYYRERKYEEARTEYLKFLDLHPQHERADEVHYFLGLTYFDQINSVDRDQSSTQKALDHFQTLTDAMPDSPYAQEAARKSEICRKKLAEKELYVGTFYFNRGRYEAALHRFKVVLGKYPGLGLDDQALYYVGESLWRLDQKERAKEAFQHLLQEHPDSRFAYEAGKRLGITVASKPRRESSGSFLTNLLHSLKQSFKELKDSIVELGKE